MLISHTNLGEEIRPETYKDRSLAGRKMCVDVEVTELQYGRHQSKKPRVPKQNQYD